MAQRSRSQRNFMTEELASRWSSRAASAAHCSTDGAAPDDRNATGMCCRYLPHI